MLTVLRTHRPWALGWLESILERWRARRRTTSLRGLDPRALADLGIDASEISSIAAEARALACQTRRRVVVQGHHG